MKEEKTIKTNTEVFRDGNILSILTYYTYCKNLLRVLIYDISKTVNGVFFKEGELGLDNDGYDDVNMSINSNGELIISSEDTKEFSINSNGELILDDSNPVCVEPEPVIPEVKYGFLYSYPVIIDSRNISNTGFSVPLLNEFSLLQIHLGGYTSAGGVMKEEGLEHWLEPNSGATNSSGFSVRGCGSRQSGGSFINLKRSVMFGIRDLYVGGVVFGGLFSDNAFFLVPITGSSNTGISIRLRADSTALSEGEFGIYIGNNGREYKTKCINGVEWMIENLAETMYRTGEYIKGYDLGVYTPMTQGEWAALTEGAMCAYDNDLTNV